MKHFAWILTMSACLLLTGSILLAEDAPKVKEGAAKDGDKVAKKTPPGDPADKGKKPTGDGENTGVSKFVTWITKILGDLTADQTREITDLDAARRKAIAEIEAKFKADYLAVLTADQRAKLDLANHPPKKPNKEGGADSPKKPDAGDKPGKDGQGDKPAKSNVGDKPAKEGADDRPQSGEATK